MEGVTHNNSPNQSTGNELSITAVQTIMEGVTHNNSPNQTTGNELPITATQHRLLWKELPITTAQTHNNPIQNAYKEFPITATQPRLQHTIKTTYTYK